MALRHLEAVQRLSGAQARAESRPGTIGPISLGSRSKQESVVREIRMLRSTWRGLETWHGRDDVTPRNRKGEATGNTNFDLNRRASPRPYLGARGGEIHPRDSPISDSC